MDPKFIQAKQDFQRARQRAKMQELAAQLTGKSVNLLVYEEVRQRLKAIESATHERKNIPIQAIIGSVGRYSDFNREFLPLRDTDRERWARVKLVIEDLSGLPPIEVYQIGEAYFVADGNHRVSIARQLGATEIEAFVRPVQTRVPLPANASEEDLILLTEYADFLEQTHLDELRPNANLRLTAAGQYAFLLQQIEVHRFLMELRLSQEVPYFQAVCEWYDDLYLPLVEMIRARNLLQNFPNRTEVDFFVWLLNHQAQLARETGWHIRIEAALRDLAEKIYRSEGSIPSRLRNAVINALPLVPSPTPAAGQWREDHRTRPGRLFGEIIAPLIGPPPWPALEGALKIAQHEHAQVYGVHLSRGPIPEIENQFWALCEKAGVQGRLAFEKGKANVILSERSRWVDLVVIPLQRDDPARARGRSLTVRSLIQQCHTPILVLPGSYKMPTRALLAYDGSPKADEALFLAAYFANFWEVELVVFSVLPTAAGQSTRPDIDYAQTYLRRYHIEATVCYVHGQTAPEILRAAQQYACDLILMGGYGKIPLFGGFRKRAVDAVLANTSVPVLIVK
ncbi:MAG: universal stress protein [Anaerolineales bacterium]